MKPERLLNRLALWLLLTSLHALCGHRIQAAQPPNVLLIMADQWRGSALNFGPHHDADVQTPHLESLASQGIHFTRCYATDPVCTPNRATLITGRYPSQTLMTKNDIMLPPDIPCVADVFKDAGYRTYYCGKWHMDGSAKPGYVPQSWRRRGYEMFEGFNRGHEYFNTSVIFDDDGAALLVPTNKPSGTLDEQLANYEPHRETDLAMAFISTNQSRPWFIHLSWGPPHTPYTPPAPFATYVGSTLTMRPNYTSGVSAASIASYYGSCSALDYEVGRLVQLIDSLGLGTNTLILFTADHGDMLGSHGMTYKSKPEEESLRVPLLMRWTGRIPAGQSSDFLISTLDLMPTILNLAALEIPGSCAGKDKSAVALGQTQGETPVFSCNNSGWRAAVKRVGGTTYKLVLGVTNSVYQPTKFWNLDNDPYKMTNLVNQPAYTAIQSQMQTNILDWQMATGDPWPAKAEVAAAAMYSDTPAIVNPLIADIQTRAEDSGVVRARSQSRLSFNLQQSDTLQPPGWTNVGEVKTGNGNILNFPVTFDPSRSFFRVQINGASSSSAGTTYFVEGGDIAGSTTNDWSIGAPTTANTGIIASNLVSGTMGNNLTDATIEQYGGTITIADGVASSRVMDGSTHYLLAGGVFQRTTAHVLRLGNNTAASDVVFAVDGGLLRLTNASSGVVFMGTDSRLDVVSGTVNCGTNRISLHTTSAHTDTPILAFVENGSGAVTCGKLEFEPARQGYVNFEDGSTGTLTVNEAILYGSTNTTFEGLWNLGRLRFQGGNDGAFTNVFQVNGPTLRLR